MGSTWNKQPLFRTDYFINFFGCGFAKFSTVVKLRFQSLSGCVNLHRRNKRLDKVQTRFPCILGLVAFKMNFNLSVSAILLVVSWQAVLNLQTFVFRPRFSCEIIQVQIVIGSFKLRIYWFKDIQLNSMSNNQVVWFYQWSWYTIL